MAGFAGLAAKAVPMLIDNAPEIWAAATQLIQSAKKAQAEIPVDAAAGAGAGDPKAIEAAIHDIEASLLTLNAQMEKTGSLVASLAAQNEVLVRRLETQRAWMVGLSVSTLFSLAMALAALVAVLAP